MDTAASAASGAISPVGYRRSPVRVLTVEEDPICLDTLIRMLQRCGYQGNVLSPGWTQLALFPR